ncbi:MAG: hypothetical protein LLG02_17125 [Pelosinus sp.]|nr:hypothetical protein [Pelosinus sp.]
MPRLNKFSKDFVTQLLALDVVSLSILPNIIALLLADGLTTDEQDLLGSFITDIGDELSTISLYLAAQETLEEGAAKETGETTDKAESEKMRLLVEELLHKNQEMQGRIDALEAKLNGL